MRSYSIERSTAEWNRILRTRLDGAVEFNKFVADIKQALEYDNNHVSEVRVELPDRMKRNP